MTSISNERYPAAMFPDRFLPYIPRIEPQTRANPKELAERIKEIQNGTFDFTPVLDLVDKALEPVIDQVFLYNVWQSDEVVLTVRALDAIFLEAFLRNTQLFSNPFPLDEQKVRDMTYLFPQRIDITTMTSFDRSYFNEHLEDWWDELDHPFKSEYASILRLKEKINSRGFDNTVEIRNGFGTARKLIWRVIEIIDTATIPHLRYDNNPYEKKKQIVEDLLTKNFGHVIGFLSMLHQYQISKVKRNDLNSYITVSFDGEWNISFDHRGFLEMIHKRVEDRGDSLEKKYTGCPAVLSKMENGRHAILGYVAWTIRIYKHFVEYQKKYH